MRFEWDPAKNRRNFRKHGVSFEQASDLFTSGMDFLEIYDERHSAKEERFLAIGPIRSGVVVVDSPADAKAGIMLSSSGNPIIAPVPRNNVRRDRCFLVMIIKWHSSFGTADYEQSPE